MMAVREVSAMRQIEAENGVSGLEHCGIGLHVGL